MAIDHDTTAGAEGYPGATDASGPGAMPSSAGAGAPNPDVFPDAAECALVDRARSGDEIAFAELVEAHHEAVFRVGMKVFARDRGKADDLCQEVFLNAWRGLSGFDGEVRFSIWLHRIAKNAAISELRKEKAGKRAQKPLSLDAPIQGHDELTLDAPARDPDPGDRVDQLDFAERVRRAVAELPEEFREAVLLRDLRGMGYEEIAEVLGIAKGTVRSRIHRGRALLQASLGGFR